jgi:acyl carrier protein
MLKDATIISYDQVVNERSLIIEDLDMDSLEKLELVMLIEKEYNVAMRDDDALKIKTVSDCIDWIIYNVD